MILLREVLKNHISHYTTPRETVFCDSDVVAGNHI
jgi:hypothetical protein